MPSGSELLDTISPQYIGDLIAWGAIGARTTESQVHRELASGFSAPIGFKNGTDGNVKIACDAILAAAQPHHFLGVHKSGQVAMVRTRGNPDCHIILRGGSGAELRRGQRGGGLRRRSREAGLPPPLMVDCSHANCGKQHERQLDVVREIARQVGGGSRRIFGAMIESHLHPGRAEVHAGPRRSRAARVRHQHHRSLPRLGADGRGIAQPEQSGTPPPQGLTSGAARQPMAAGALLRTAYVGGRSPRKAWSISRRNSS